MRSLGLTSRLARAPDLDRPLMKPNRILLTYLVLFGVALAAVSVLAWMVIVLFIGSWLTGRQMASLDDWLLRSTVLTLGLLPWPGLVVLARSLLRLGRPEAFRVESLPVGMAAVVLTTLNDQQATEQTVRDFVGCPGVGSVIVVDNGSTDRTREVAASAGARVVLEERRGYGFACIRALAEGLQTGHPAVILCEADCTFRAEDTQKLTAYLRHADLVIGSRTHRALLNSDSQLNSFFILGNLFVAKLLQARYWDWTLGGKVRLTDVGCTYRAIRADALRRILPALEVGGNYFSPHMIMVALEHRLRVIEVPVTFWKRVGVSKGGNANWRKGFALGLVMIWHILTYRVRRNLETTNPGERSRHAVS